MPKVFFITGCSTVTGFGHQLVKVVLANGDKAIATSRNGSSLKFDGANKDNFLGVSLDVTSNDSIDDAFEAGLKAFGRVDVVVNNAGFGLSGEFESLSDDQIRQQMDVNFFGLIAVTRKAMKVMRDLKTGGLIQQVTSIGGQRGVPLFSIYCASKWAVEGFTEAVSQEVKPEWGIKFTCIEPGGFRTDWAGPSMIFGKKLSPDPYDHLDARATMGARHGNQGGDPVKGAQAMYKLALLPDPPLRVLLGSDAYAAMETKLKTYSERVKAYEEITKSTDVDK
ncbi:NAD(P)-binding protein [Meredithblackwellia eburnea MCA 4105]